MGRSRHGTTARACAGFRRCDHLLAGVARRAMHAVPYPRAARRTPVPSHGAAPARTGQRAVRLGLLCRLRDGGRAPLCAPGARRHARRSWSAPPARVATPQHRDIAARSTSAAPSLRLCAGRRHRPARRYHPHDSGIQPPESWRGRAQGGLAQHAAGQPVAALHRAPPDTAPPSRLPLRAPP